jgi:hypothetical protein
MALQGHYFSLVNADPTLTEGEFYFGNVWLGKSANSKEISPVYHIVMIEWHNETVVCDNTIYKSDVAQWMSPGVLLKRYLILF